MTYNRIWLMTSWSFLHSWLITGFVTSSTRQVSLVEQELLTLPGGVRVTRSLVLCACFVDRCFSLSFYTFSFGHCVVCSSIYGLWLPLLYLQPLLTRALLKVHINSQTEQASGKKGHRVFWISQGGDNTYGRKN